MNTALEHFLNGLPDEDADDSLVELIAIRMRERLAECRDQGKSGWHTSSCSIEVLMAMLDDNIEEESWIDVINLAAMILAKQELAGREM